MDSNKKNMNNSNILPRKKEINGTNFQSVTLEEDLNPIDVVINTLFRGYLCSKCPPTEGYPTMYLGQQAWQVHQKKVGNLCSDTLLMLTRNAFKEILLLQARHMK